MKRKARRLVALSAVALMMTASLPFAEVSGVFTGGLTALADSTDSEALNVEGGKLVFRLKDYNIVQKSSALSGTDTITIFATTLDENGNVSQVGKTTADDWQDVSTAVYSIPYVEGRGYTMMVEHAQKGNSAGNREHYYFDESSQTWVQYYIEGVNIGTLPPLTIQFTDEVLGEFANVITDDSIISVYKKNADGTQTLVKKVHKYNGDNADVMFIPALESGDYVWTADIDYTETYARTEKHITGTVTGSWLAVKPYVADKDLTIETKTLDKEVETTSPSGMIIFDLEYPEVDASGNRVYDKDGKPIMHSIKDIDHGDAWIIKNTEVVQDISARDLECSIPILENYDATATYFMKIALDKSNNEYLFYKYNPETGWWDFRVSTVDTPLYKAPITITQFEDEYAEGILYNKKSDSGNSYDGNEADTWTKEEYAGGSKTVNILTNDNNYIYTVFFDYGKDGGIYYQYVGIDPVPIYSYGKRAEGILVNTIDIPTNAGAGETVVVDGTDKDGNKVHYEKDQDYNDDDIKVPADGDYTVTNTDTGLGSNVTDGDFEHKDTEDENKMNLTEPVVDSSYVIKDATGEVVSEGKLNGEAPVTLNNLITDAGIPAKQVGWMKEEPYYAFETTSGVINSTKEGDCIKDSGYFVLDTTPTAKTGDIVRIYLTDVRGDINQDGKFNIADAVLEQKYLLDNLGSKDKFDIKSFIASDVVTDGSSDIFDMVELRKMLIEQMKTENDKKTETTKK